MGKQLVRRETLTVMLALAALACAERRSADAPRPADATQGIVIRVRTTVPEQNRSFHDHIISAGGVVRPLGELDRWRLLDFENGRVTWVDSITRTTRTASLDELWSEKKRVASGNIPASYPTATVRRTGQTQIILGQPTEQFLIEAGGFRRELWITTRPLLGKTYMALRFGSEQTAGNNPAALARIQLALMQLEGFPMLDSITFQVGEETWGITREVEAITETELSRSQLEVPEDYDEEGDAEAEVVIPKTR